MTDGETGGEDLEQNLREKILKLKKDRNALILAHNYQMDQIQDIADFVGSKLAPMDGIKGTSTIFVLKMYKRDGVILKKNDEEKQKRQLASL